MGHRETQLKIHFKLYPTGSCTYSQRLRKYCHPNKRDKGLSAYPRFHAGFALMLAVLRPHTQRISCVER